MPYVYLIRKPFWEKGVFKIGCSDKSGYDRIKSYGKEVKILALFEVKDCREVEKNLKVLFNSKFRLIAGKEHFQGNEDEIKLEFLKTVYTHQINSHQKSDTDNSVGICESKIDTDNSVDVCESKIDTDNSVGICENKNDTDNSVGICESKNDIENSVGICKTENDIENSVGICESKNDIENSVGICESKINTDNSIDVCESKIYTDNSVVEKHFKIGSHNDIAKSLYEKYRYDFVCSSIVKKNWFQFKNNIWKKIEYEVVTEYFISYIQNTLIKMGQEISQKMASEEDKYIKNELKTNLKTIKKIYEKCKSAPFKNNVMHETMEVFYKVSREPSIHSEK